MKKPLLVLLALGLVLALVVGCSGDATPAPTSAPAAAATTAPAPAPAATKAPAPAATTAPAAAPTAAPTKAAAPTAAPTTAPAASGGDTALLNKMKDIEKFSADMVAEAAGQTTEGKMTFTKTKMRVDLKAMGMSISMLVDQDAKTAYMYNEEDNTALAMPYDEAVDESADVNALLNWEEGMVEPPKYVGDETIDGKACAIYEFTNEDSTSKTWIDKSLGFPLKVVTTADGETATIMFKNIKIGNIDESVLSLPADVEIMDMSTLMGGLPTPPAP